jgi:hypothetical protein
VQSPSKKFESLPPKELKITFETKSLKFECGLSVTANRGSKQRIRWASWNGASLSDTLRVFRESLGKGVAGPAKNVSRDRSRQRNNAFEM